MTDFAHEPVLLREVVDALAPRGGGVIVDCTLGGGGHAGALLAAADCRVIGLDRDPAALAAARDALAPYGERLTTARARFSELPRVLDGLGIERVDGILADLGVSSHQLDTPGRGFSFRASGPVDMRMDPDAPLSAAELVDTWDADALADVIRRYGEERHAKRVAQAIVAGRPWTDTKALAEVVAKAAGQVGRIHGATRTFQALRIAVNDELGELEALLASTLDRLVAGGRVAIITFHSLEDRLVKRFFDTQSGKGRPRDPYGNPIGPAHLELLKDRAPSSDDPNPRARSARLRAAVRLPWNAQ